MQKNSGKSDDKNIDDLNQMLFAQIERLVDASDEEHLRDEVARTTAIVKAASAMIAAGKIALAAYDLAGGHGSTLPSLIQQGKIAKISNVVY